MAVRYDAISILYCALHGVQGSLYATYSPCVDYDRYMLLPLVLGEEPIPFCPDDPAARGGDGRWCCLSVALRERVVPKLNEERGPSSTSSMSCGSSVGGAGSPCSQTSPMVLGLRWKAPRGTNVEKNMMPEQIENCILVHVECG